MLKHRTDIKRGNQSTAGSRPDVLLHRAHALSRPLSLLHLSQREHCDSRPKWKGWLCVWQSWKNTCVALLTHRFHWTISAGLSCAVWLLMWVSMTIKSLYISCPTSAELMTRLSLQRAAEDAKQRGNNYSLSILIGQNKWQGSGKGVEMKMKSNYYMMWGGWCV